jgi:phage shock protein C
MKRLYKSRKNKVIAGVCGGIGEYFNVDPVLIRLIAVLFFFTGGAALIAYVVGMIIMPNQPWEASADGEVAKTQSATSPVQTESLGPAGSLIIGVILIVFGVHFLLRRVPFFSTYYWWFWNRSWDFFWPAILIAVGLFIIFKAARK